VKYQVTNVRLHQSIHVQGIGELGTSLPASGKVIPGLIMEEGDYGIECSANAGRWVIPYANVVVAKRGNPVEVKSSKAVKANDA
jgi:hypothetical protein